MFQGVQTHQNVSPQFCAVSKRPQVVRSLAQFRAVLRRYVQLCAVLRSFVQVCTILSAQLPFCVVSLAKTQPLCVVVFNPLPAPGISLQDACIFAK